MNVICNSNFTGSNAELTLNSPALRREWNSMENSFEQRLNTTTAYTFRRKLSLRWMQANNIRWGFLWCLGWNEGKNVFRVCVTSSSQTHSNSMSTICPNIAKSAMISSRKTRRMKHKREQLSSKPSENRQISDSQYIVAELITQIEI